MVSNSYLYSEIVSYGLLNAAHCSKASAGLEHERLSQVDKEPNFIN